LKPHLLVTQLLQSTLAIQHLSTRGNTKANIKLKLRNIAFLLPHPSVR